MKALNAQRHEAAWSGTQHLSVSAGFLIWQLSWCFKILGKTYINSTEHGTKRTILQQERKVYFSWTVVTAQEKKKKAVIWNLGWKEPSQNWEKHGLESHIEQSLNLTWRIQILIPPSAKWNYRVIVKIKNPLKRRKQKQGCFVFGDD